jgi:hypothetical protein
MGDMIDRDAVLKAITKTAVKWGVTGEPAILIATKAAIRALPAEPAEDVRAGALTVAQAAQVLLDAMTARPPLADPFDACDVEVERLAIEYSSQGGDAVMVLETAEKFMLAGLRALIPEAKP